jgi:hypothetical protein
MTVSGPRGWNAATVSHRFADASPSSYNSETHTVDCVISMGSPVVRFYGTEVLRISPEAVGLDRMSNGSIIPLLDSHQAGGINNALGRFTNTWFKRGGLMGTIAFNQTPNGKLAEGMVASGEIAGISAGYCVRSWQITDQDNNVIDPEVTSVRWDDDLTFTATKWDLHEASLVSVPADHLSGIRSLGGGDRAFIGGGHVGAARQRMETRERMHVRQAMHDAAAMIGKHHE